MVIIFSADRFVQIKCRFNGSMWCIGRLKIYSFHKERKMAVPRIGEEERVHLGGFKKREIADQKAFKQEAFVG